MYAKQQLTGNGQPAYFLYARKSSEGEDRQVASIDSQIEELKRLAAREELRIIDVLSEAKSAKAPGRPVFNDMIQRIYRGEAQGILCWKLDRLARNPVDGGTINWMLQQGAIQHIRAYDRSYQPTDNVLMMSVEFGMANQFIRDLSVNAKRGLRSKAERGWFPGPAPIGYHNTPLRAQGQKEITEADNWPSIQKLFELALMGTHSVPKILEIGSENLGIRYPDGRKIGRSTMYRILTNPFYSGSFEYPRGSGNWYEGKHKPMLSREEFNRLQLILGNKRHPRSKFLSFPYRGPLKCGECGCLITAEKKKKVQKNGNVHLYTYYHCTKRRMDVDCTQSSIEEKVLEKEIATVLASIEIPKGFVDWALNHLKSQNHEESESREHSLKNYRKQYDAVARRIDALIDMRANGEISEEEFKAKKEMLSKEKNHFNGLLNDVDARVDDWLKRAEELYVFASTATKNFAEGSPDQRKEILATLGSNLLLKDGKIVIKGNNRLIHLQNVSEAEKKVSAMFEPLKNGMVEQQKETLYSQSPVLLGGRDSNPRPIGYILSSRFRKGWTISSPFKLSRARGASLDRAAEVLLSDSL